MAVDKVKPLGYESPSGGGTESFPTPTELDPLEDYVSSKGLAFEGTDTFLAEKIGGILGFKIPDTSQKPTYLGNGEVDFVEFFNGATQTTPNRLAKVTMAYDGSFNPTSETWLIYSLSDGTTVLRTLTLTHTFTGVDLTKSVEVTT